jgi:hypothetical protein
MKTFNERSADDPSSRHYLGLWLWDVDEKLDYLACAWRDGERWFTRARFRYFVAPLHESRYAIDVKADAEPEAINVMNRAINASKIGFENAGYHVPVRYIPIHGNAQTAVEIIPAHDLLRQAVDIPWMPVLYDAHALKASAIAAGGRDLAELIRKQGKTEKHSRDVLRMWTLDAFVDLRRPRSGANGEAAIERRRGVPNRPVILFRHEIKSRFPKENP